MVSMRRVWRAFLALFIAPGAAWGSVDSAFDFGFERISGRDMPLAEYRGKALLIVNTASECGFTGQYGGLQALYERYQDRGLVVIGVPSNDFGNQEPGSETEIKRFCETKYRVTFPLTAKYPVTGENAHPFYRWARAQKGWLAAPKWNFHKYLIAPDGRLVDWFSSMTEPESDRVVQAIEAVLPQESQ